MKLFEKIRIFKDAAVSAYKEMNADRDLAIYLSETATLLKEKYLNIARLCKSTADGITTVRDQFEGQFSRRSLLATTLTNAITLLRDYVTVKKGEDPVDPSLVSYLLTYDTSLGSAFNGVYQIFERLSNTVSIHANLIQEKIKSRNFKGAIRQYARMKETLYEECTLLGVKRPPIRKVNLDKYKNTEENDN